MVACAENLGEERGAEPGGLVAALSGQSRMVPAPGLREGKDSGDLNLGAWPGLA